MINRNKHVTQRKVFYPAKLLLFGEHVLLLGAPALAMPTPAFGGRWVMADDPAAGMSRQRDLATFARSEALASVHGLEHKRLEADLEAGLFFDSNIPTGYGLGSSGALCAAVYDRYCVEKTDDISELKQIFAGMESYFHGNSSGIDPLTSYVGKPLLIEEKTKVQVVEMPDWSRLPQLFLADTRLPRQTGPLVRWFLEQAETNAFAAMLQAKYLPAHQRMLNAWLDSNADAFWEALSLVSALQYEYFTPMVPDSVRAAWRASLESEDYRFKICGAGGGGYILGFAKSGLALDTCGKQFRLTLPFQT
jgi:mevalonate kinase